MARKLILTRDDTADRVIEAINASKESAITVVAPRGSALSDREGLARIGEASVEKGVAVAVESVDEELLGLAHAAHLETVHPFFRADRRHLSLDGIVKNEVEHPRVPVHVEESEPEVIVEDDAVEVDEEPEEAPVVHAQRPMPPHNHPMPTPVAARPARESRPTQLEMAEDKPRRKKPWLRISVATVVIVALIIGVGEGFLRGATVSVTLAETQWDYSGRIMAATSVTTSTGGALAIPGQLFVADKNVAQGFPATGEPGASATPASSKVKVTVYNESLDAETFVVKTRFQGKSGIFRALSAVAIPAAKKEGDKLAAGSASVEVAPESSAVLDGAADQERLTVPGLAGSPKAALFYAILSKPAAAATKPADSTTPPQNRVVTADDEANAKKQINNILSTSFRTSLLASQPAGLALIDGAIQVEPGQLTVNKEVDAAGNFNMVGQATLRGLAFSEDNLKSLLLKQAATQINISYPAEFRKADITYTDVQPDLANGRLTFTVNIKSIIVGKTTEDAVRSETAGKSRSDVAAWIKSQSMFSGGSVSVSPLWRFAVPSEPAKVRVEVK
jgi:hypothetical protein